MEHALTETDEIDDRSAAAERFGLVLPPNLDDVFLMLPEQVGRLDLTGCTAARALPDGRLAAVEPLMFNQARLCLGRPEIMAADAPWCGWDETWDYGSGMAALVALATWEPSPETPEPTGWHRHHPSNRRRPGGDPSCEEVRP